MTQNTENDLEPVADEQGVDEANETEAAEDEAVPPAAEDMSADERIAYLENQCEELNQRWLRAQADYKNLKRRALTEHELSLQRTMQPLLEELLLVLDFLDMALSHPAENPETKNLAMGVEMTRTKFVQALDASDVREIPTSGAFDPKIHDATDTEPAADVEPGTIVRTLRRGYTWQGRVLRPAQVVVAVAEGEEAAPGAKTHEPRGSRGSHGKSKDR